MSGGVNSGQKGKKSWRSQQKVTEANLGGGDSHELEVKMGCFLNGSSWMGPSEL